MFKESTVRKAQHYPKELLLIIHTSTMNSFALVKSERNKNFKPFVVVEQKLAFRYLLCVLRAFVLVEIHSTLLQ